MVWPKLIFRDGHILYQDKMFREHRKDCPAIITTHGVSKWKAFGQSHRQDGPAIVSPSGHAAWWKWDTHQRSVPKRDNREDPPGWDHDLWRLRVAVAGAEEFLGLQDLRDALVGVDELL
jgi:hypothetical protein